MAQDIESKLDAILSAKQQRESELHDRQRAAKLKSQQELATFETLTLTMIIPTLREFAKKLHVRNIEAEVAQEEPGILDERTIKLMLVKGDRGLKDCPCIEINFSSDGNVRFRKSVGGFGTQANGMIPLDGLSREYIEEKVLAWFAETQA